MGRRHTPALPALPIFLCYAIASCTGPTLVCVRPQIKVKTTTLTTCNTGEERGVPAVPAVSCAVDLSGSAVLVVVSTARPSA